jgi:hypothetical protein
MTRLGQEPLKKRSVWQAYRPRPQAAQTLGQINKLSIKEEKNRRMSTAMEKATAFLSKLEADRMAAIAVSEEQMREAMLIKAREEGFREAMEIFGLSIASDSEVETSKPRRGKRRDIRQMIIKELSFSGKAMSREQIAKAIDYIPEGTEAALKRLESARKIVQNRDGHWETVAITVAQPNGHTH